MKGIVFAGNRKAELRDFPDPTPGDEDVVRKLLGDLVSANVDTDESSVRSALHDATVEARRQLMGIEG